MKILFLHALADPNRGGGAEVIVWEQILGLRNAGHECVLLATSDKLGLERSEREGITIWQAGIRNVYWPYQKKQPLMPRRLVWHALDSYNPWMQGYLRVVIKQEKPDVASVNNLPGWSAASWATLALQNVPAVQVLHDYYPICVKTTMYQHDKNCVRQCASCRLFRLPHRSLSRRVQAVVGVSRFILDRHLALGYFDAVPIQRVIHNARNAYTLGCINRKPTTTVTHDSLRYGFIGRLDPSKGIETLITTFLSADIPSAELWIAGTGKPSYEQHLRKLADNPQIKFLGWQQPADFYPQVDVVVVPSLWNEALGMVAAEALAFGKPVIGSRRGGIPEIIRDGHNGWLIEPTNHQAFTDLLKSLSTQPEMIIARVPEALASSIQYTDTRSWIQQYVDLYQEVIETQRHASEVEK